MGAEERGDVTAMLSDVRAGCPGAQDRLARVVHNELLRIAQRMMRHERPDHTLEADALVHEAWLRLFGGEAQAELPNRRLFRTAVVQAMRRVLVEHARRRQAGKRGGQRVRIPLDGILASFEERGVRVIDLHEALERLARTHPRQASVVEHRFFGRLSITEVADTLGVSDGTVESDWRFARAWLRSRLGDTDT
jgi:RNA polymerase sigma factor (TIGR02999 family)